MRYLLYVLLIGSVCTIWTSCSKSSNSYNYGTPGGGTPPGGSTGNTISIYGYAFSPASLTVTKGTTVKWTNNDPVTHTVTDDNGKFDSGNLTSGKTYSYTFNDTGTYHYHCSIHTNMKGTITVQ
ncbi:MAG: cupredoxin family copper-binding protein [Thermoflavifilum sp.]|nr:cupredoxin family copper-binding protein [Thermoflavifilum sp.]